MIYFDSFLYKKKLDASKTSKHPNMSSYIALPHAFRDTTFRLKRRMVGIALPSDKNALHREYKNEHACKAQNMAEVLYRKQWADK